MQLRISRPPPTATLKPATLVPAASANAGVSATSCVSACTQCSRQPLIATLNPAPSTPVTVTSPDPVIATPLSFGVTIVTQNVDNLHERAGSTRVLHLHGELAKARSTLDPRLGPADYELMIDLLHGQLINAYLSLGFPAGAVFAHAEGTHRTAADACVTSCPIT